MARVPERLGMFNDLSNPFRAFKDISEPLKNFQNILTAFCDRLYITSFEDDFIALLLPEAENRERVNTYFFFCQNQQA